jgi:hypothetical protein
MIGELCLTPGIAFALSIASTAFAASIAKMIGTYRPLP